MHDYQMWHFSAGFNFDPFGQLYALANSSELIITVLALQMIINDIFQNIISGNTSPDKNILISFSY
jgi:hypothetical protein